MTRQELWLLCFLFTLEMCQTLQQIILAQEIHKKKQSNLIKFVTKLANFNFNLVLLNLSVSKFLFGLVIVVFMAIKLV